jgi:hypothetical protein
MLGRAAESDHTPLMVSALPRRAGSRRLDRPWNTAQIHRPMTQPATSYDRPTLPRSAPPDPRRPRPRERHHRPADRDGVQSPHGRGLPHRRGPARQPVSCIARRMRSRPNRSSYHVGCRLPAGFDHRGYRGVPGPACTARTHALTSPRPYPGGYARRDSRRWIGWRPADEVAVMLGTGEEQREDLIPEQLRRFL